MKSQLWISGWLRGGPRKQSSASLLDRRCQREKMEPPSITKDKDAEINGDVEARLQQLKRIYEQGLIEK